MMKRTAHGAPGLDETPWQRPGSSPIRTTAQSKWLRKLAFCCFGFVLLALTVRPAAGQNSSIQGQVTDPQGAAIPGTHVVATNIGTGVAVAVGTNNAGLYVLPDLLTGRYRLEITKAGFGPVVKNDIELQVNQTMELNFALTVGRTVQNVTVAGTGEVLNTATTTVGQVISNQQVLDLPLNGRNYLQLAVLTPGASPANDSRAESLGAFSALGQDSYQMNIMLDGVRNSTIFSGGELGYQAQAVAPPVDAINEFEVVTNNNSAEYGVRMGGTIIASTKSGTNRLHGDGYEFLRNTVLNAANFFASGEPKPPLEQNQFGGTLGGPIIRNKTFFFGSYQGTRIHSGAADVSTVPTAAERAGNFAGQNIIYDPATTAANPSGSGDIRTAFPSNLIPKGRLDQVAANVINLYPLPNLPGTVNNYYFSGAGHDDTNEVDARVDHDFNSSERMYVRYSNRMEDELTPGNLPYPADGGTAETVSLGAHNGVVGLTSTISPTLVNDLVLGLSIFNTVIGIPWTTDLDSQLGIKGVPDLGPANQIGMTLFDPTGYAEVGAQAYWPNYNNLDTEQFSDKILYSRGHHMITTGFQFFRDGQNRLAERFGRGQMNFAGYFTENPQSRGNTGNGMADFLLGDASGGTLGNFAGETLITHNFGAFFQDNWQVNKRLTLNLGLRWDLFHPPTYHYHDVMSRFDIFPGTPDYDSFQYAASDSDCGCAVNSHNFAPRVGFAFQITPKTVIRSGFGIFFGMTDSYNDSAERYEKEAPQWTEISFPTDELFQPALIVSTGFPPGLLPTNTVEPDVAIQASFAKMPDQYAEEWFMDVQRELGPRTTLTVSYLGTGSHYLTLSINPNQPYVPGAGSVQSRRPFNYYAGITLWDPEGDANYNALTVKLDKRFSQGLTLLTSYTYSHSLDDVSEIDNNEGGEGLENAYNVGGNWGNSVFDLRHDFVTSAIYDLPFGSGRRFMNRNGILNGVLGGWRLGGIWSVQSGFPFSPLVSTDVTNVGGTDRPNAIANGNLPRGQRSIHDWFNRAAYSVQPAYTYGNAMRDSLYGPGIVNVDLNLSKAFPITESKLLEFRGEAFDVANNPHFGFPNMDINLPQGGTITSAAAPREFQLALKFLF